jgi:hypothetical protein
VRPEVRFVVALLFPTGKKPAPAVETSPERTFMKRIAILMLWAAASSPLLRAGPVESNREVTAVTENAWSFNLSIYGWATAIDGTISAGNRNADVDIAFKDVVKHLDMTFMGAAELRYKRWGFMGDLVYARLHDDIAPPAGIVFSSTHEVVKETISTFLLSYRAVDAKPAYLDVFAGARVYDFYAQIRLQPNLGQVGVNNGGTNTWVDPIIGVRGRYYVSRAVFLNGYGDIGVSAPAPRLAGRSSAASESRLPAGATCNSDIALLVSSTRVERNRRSPLTDPSSGRRFVFRRKPKESII